MTLGHAVFPCHTVLPHGVTTCRHVRLVQSSSLYCPSCLAFCCSLPAFTICEIDKNIITSLCITVLQVFIQREMYKDEIVFLLQEYKLLLWNEKHFLILWSPASHIIK